MQFNTYIRVKLHSANNTQISARNVVGGIKNIKTDIIMSVFMLIRFSKKSVMIG